MKVIEMGKVKIGDDKPVLIAGPCAIESEGMAIHTAEKLTEIAQKFAIPFVFKGSYDKANRLSIQSGRGLGFPAGLSVLRKIKENLDIPILTDVHETYQVEAVASVVDILQIPAFLCRQTDLILAVASTGKVINIKKGQFIQPDDMKYLIGKAEFVGNDKIILTERGTCFGYGDLIFDPRSVIIMKEFGYPILVDVTHLCQRPGTGEGMSSGNRKYAVPFAKIGLTLGASGIYMEVHPQPENAISDKDIQIPLDNAEQVIREIFEV
ncbi:3-deoxy-8-phosphooctulonate synthase [bacterium]|nr:MAG: 3-deoxy-8-phosphooctulonate synthase [bacterium]